MCDDRGYVMVILLMGMAIAAVWMASTLPAWRQQAVRQKEEELIFRGQQYARAIALFYRKNNRSLPSDIDTLVSGHYLRRKWKDPITNDDFALLGQVPQPGATNGRGQPGTTGTPGSTATPGRAGTPTATTPGRAGNPTGTSSSVPSPLGGGSGQFGVGGITGVASKSTDTSIKIYQNQQQYNLWQFTMTTSGVPLGNNQQQGPAQNGRGGPGNQPGGLQQRPGGPGGLGPGGRGPGGGAPPGAPPPPPGRGGGRGGI